MQMTPAQIRARFVFIREKRILLFGGEVLLKQILNKGRPVLIKNPSFEKKFKMTALSQIADFNFYLGKMQSGLKRKILEK